MKPRHLLARLAAVVTAAAAIGMFLGPARADASDHDDPDGTVNRDSTSAMAADIDSWGNRDLDIGALNASMAEELGSRLDGWDTSDMDLNPTDLWEATAFGIGGRLDGWATRDQDIGARSSTDGIGGILDGWGNRDMDIGTF
jgi:hypothetical protein